MNKKNILLLLAGVIFILMGALPLGVFDFVAGAPPSPARLEGVIGHGLSADPVRKTTSVGTTIDDLVDTDLADGLQVDGTTQLVVVTNKHASQNLCVGSVAYSGTGAACINKCGTAANWTQFSGSTMTCSGAATDGSLILPSTQREFRFDGTRCLCIVASGATTTFQAERVAR